MGVCMFICMYACTYASMHVRVDCVCVWKGVKGVSELALYWCFVRDIQLQCEIGQCLLAITQG